MPGIGFKSAMVLAAVLSLAACKSVEERAEERFQSGMSLLEEGDVDRALVEFRNVFELDGRHREARAAYARTVLANGKRREAYGQYLRLVEQYPDDLEGRSTLAELAFASRNWDELERHGSVAVQAAPDAIRSKAIDVAMRYRMSIVERDDPARAAVVTLAETLIQEDLDNAILRRVLIDSYSRDGRYDDALIQVDAAIADDPDNREFYNQRLALVGQTGDAAVIEAQLREMVTLFPEDQDIKNRVLRFYMSRGESDKAETFLRDLSDPTDGDPSLYLSLVQFLAQVRGEEAALEELEKGITQAGDPLLFRALRAGFVFNRGERDAAIADMEELLAQNAPTEDTPPEAMDEIQGVKVTLARMQLGNGNEVGARRLIEEVLEQSPTQTEALKMRARWLITADETDAAISALRTALDQNAQDADAMTLMSEAYSRAGSHDLARDFLALAVDASGNAPQETIRHARLLISEESFLPAESILIAALRLAPGNQELLGVLGQVYIAMEDVSRARQVVSTLRRIASASATSAANALETALLSREQGTDGAIAFLEGLAGDENADIAAKLAVLRARMLSGDAQGALSYAQELVAEEPENLRLGYALAATRGANGDLVGAEAGYRTLLAKDPARARAWLELSQIMRLQGKRAEAVQAIDDGLAANGDNPGLLWAKASYLEQNGDIDGAIAIYEDVYSRQSGSQVVANNLASLLATYRDDAESLDRAFAVARRLRDTDVPAFQDTYGWITFRRGNVEEALPYLEGAAAGLPNDALVQYHLGSAYLAAERRQDALERFERAVEIAGPGDTRAQIETARAEIARLQNQGEN